MNETDICRRFTDANDLRQWLVAQLVAQGITMDLANRIAPHLIEQFESGGRTTDSLGAVGKGWAIRYQDLNSIEAAAKGLLAALGVYSGGPIAVGVAAGAVALVLLLVSAYRNGITISEDQQSVLLGLKVHDAGCSTATLQGWLADTRPDGDWGFERVCGILASLQRIALRSGTVIALVAEDAESYWHAQNV